MREEGADREHERDVEDGVERLGCGCREGDGGRDVVDEAAGGHELAARALDLAPRAQELGGRREEGGGKNGIR